MDSPARLGTHFYIFLGWTRTCTFFLVVYDQYLYRTSTMHLHVGKAGGRKGASLIVQGTIQGLSLQPVDQ